MLAFLYYTAWVLLLPMWSPEHAPWLHEAFPDRLLALKVPGLFLLSLTALLVAFVGLVLAGAFDSWPLDGSDRPATRENGHVLEPNWRRGPLRSARTQTR